MSVINNMLKDLESRSSHFTPIEIDRVESETDHRPGRGNSLKFAGITLSLLLVSSLIYFHFGDPVVEAPVPTGEAVAVSQPTEAMPVDSSSLPLNRINGLQMKESAEQLHLEFSLADRVVSYLKERSENRFVYHLKDIRSEIAAPSIQDNRWIKRLSITPSDQGVDIAFDTTAEVLVETRQSVLADGPLWAIALSKTQQVEVQAAINTAKVNIPQPAETIVPVKVETPVEPEPAVKMVKLDIKSSQPAPSEVERLQRALTQLNNRRWAEAESLLNDLLGGEQDLAARRHLMTILQQKRQTGQYRAFLQSSIALYPDQALFKTELARWWFKRGNYQASIDLLQDGKGVDAGQLALLAASYQRIDQHAQAVRYFQQSLDIDRLQAKNWIGLGISQEQNAQLQQALDSYRSASKIGSLNARLETFIAKRIQQLEQAIN